MKRKILAVFLLLSFTVCMFDASAQGTDGYTYTYTNNGEAVDSPDAMVLADYYSCQELGIDSMKAPADIKTDSRGYIYISDTGNNRILIFDDSFTLIYEISSFMNGDQPETFNAPAGLWLSGEDHLFVADQSNQRLVEFDAEWQPVRIIGAPVSDMIPEDYQFFPSSVTTDQWGYIYVVSYNTNHGILKFSAEGEFLSFVGAARVTLTAAEKFWRAVYTKEQRKRTATAVSPNYNFVAADGEGFLFATLSSGNTNAVKSAISSRSTTSSVLPVRRFNFNGDDILERNGAFPPIGDLSFETEYKEGESRAAPLRESRITGMCFGENGVYYLMDSNRCKIFAYDQEGDLLYAFGKSGIQQGCFDVLQAITYRDGRLYALDSSRACVSVFTFTEYGQLLNDTMGLVEQRNYGQLLSNWQSILAQNNNLELAYIGIGNAQLNNGNYRAAMDAFESVNYTSGYSKAFQKYREELFGRFFILIPVGLVLVLVGVSLLFKKIAGFNAARGEESYRLGGHLLYSFYLAFHPFDGFWDAKHEKRGSVKAAGLLLALSTVCMIVKTAITGFIFSGGSTSSSLSMGIMLVFPLMLLTFCVSNWCLTSLTDGKGTFRDIFMVVGYSTFPIALTAVPIGLLSNILVAEESGFISVLTAVMYLWFVFLLVNGIMVIHQYTFSKNVVSILLTVVGMLIVLFIPLLVVHLFERISTFFGNIYTEISLR